MRFFLNGILLLITLLACVTENIYLQLWPVHPKQVIPITIRCELPFTFDQEKALGGKRQRALSQYVPLYSYLPERAKQAREVMTGLIHEVSSLREKRRTGGKELADYLKKELHLELSREEAGRLLRYKDITQLLEGVQTLEESILKGNIVEDAIPLAGKKKLEVLYPRPAGIVAHSVADIITLEQARLLLEEKVRQLFWQVDKRVLQSVLQISETLLSANLRYDQRENDRRIEEIIRRYPSKVIAYNPGDILVPFRKVLSEQDVLLLDEYSKQQNYSELPWLITVIFFTLLLYNLFLSRIFGSNSRKRTPYLLLLSLLLITVVLFKACLLFTAFPIYFIPFALLPFLIVLLNNDGVPATWTTITGAILLTLFACRTLSTLLFFTFSGMVALLLSSRIHKRVHLL
ncbi:MAG: hypothetical protein JRJ12_13015, partial [Deltaproteobacteria bacterium]|nr:hypothetical protein [Deltaproteobacteria bacterium]